MFRAVLERKSFSHTLAQNTRGSVQVEQIVLLSTVAVGFVSVMIPLIAMLYDYCQLIETVLLLPVP